MDPKKRLAPQLDRAEKHIIKSQKHWHLDQHGQTSAQRINSVISIQLHHFRIQFRRFLFKLFLNLLQFRCQDLHLFHALIRLGLWHPEDRFEQDGQNHDRPAVTTHPFLNRIHHYQKWATDDPHPAKLHHLVLPMREPPQPPILFGPGIQTEGSDIFSASH